MSKNINRLLFKQALLEEANALSKEHPSKDCRAFALNVIKWFKIDAEYTISELKGGQVYRQLTGQLTPGCHRNF